MNYIESHPQLVNILIFTTTLIVAWLTGALRVIKGLSQKLDNRLRTRIEPVTATLTYLKEYEIDDKPAKRFAFWLCFSLYNPTETTHAVTEFELRFRDMRQKWSKPLLPITFPSVPRPEIGDSIKFMRVYFSRFPYLENLLGGEFYASGTLKPKESQSGYLLFVEEFWGTCLPLVTKRGVRIKLTCRDSRGKAYRSKGWARSLSRTKAFEIIPGLDKYTEGERYLSSLQRWENSIDRKSEEGKNLLEELQSIENNHKP